jgi:hypothetical protein
LTNLYFKASFGQVPNYLVRLEADGSISSYRMGFRMTDCETEIVDQSGANWGHHIYCDTARNIFTGGLHVGGRADNTPTPPHAIFFGPQGDENVVNPYTVSSQGGGDAYIARDTAASGNAIWTPADYTGTATVE